MFYPARLKGRNMRNVATANTEGLCTEVANVAANAGLTVNNLLRLAVDLQEVRKSLDGIDLSSDHLTDVWCDFYKIPYVRMLLAHPSINDELLPLLDDGLRGDLEFFCGKGWSAPEERTARPTYAPVALSLFFRTPLAGDRSQVLLAIRNNKVAVNAGAVQSTLDEGLREDSVRAIVLMGLCDEYGLSTHEATRLCDLIVERSEIALFVTPSSLSTGSVARSAVNRVFEIVMSESDFAARAAMMQDSVASLNRSPEIRSPLAIATVLRHGTVASTSLTYLTNSQEVSEPRYSEVVLDYLAYVSSLAQEN